MKPLSENGPPSEGVPLASVPSKIARFYQVNDVSKFLLDRPMPKGTVDKENEFKVRNRYNLVKGMVLGFKPLDPKKKKFLKFCDILGKITQHLLKFS